MNLNLVKALKAFEEFRHNLVEAGYGALVERLQDASDHFHHVIPITSHARLSEHIYQSGKSVSREKLLSVVPAQINQ